MFSGIIKEIGTVNQAQKSNGIVRLVIHAPKTASRVSLLESIAVNGVCLSVTKVKNPELTFEIIPETQELTSLAQLKAHHRIHVEPSLTLVDRINGHILLGHVDGKGTIVKRVQKAGELIYEIRVDRKLRQLIVPKGPIAINGVSLTIGRKVTASTFAIHLIPETLRQTTLGDLAEGGQVNIEIDYLAKLTWQFLRTRR